MRPTTLCNICGKSITNNNFERHLQSCSRPKIAKKIRGKDYDPNIGYVDGTRQVWNKGLTKETDEITYKASITLSNTQKEKVRNGTYKVSVMSDESKRKASERQSLHNSGGKCKWYKVNGVSVQGTWERNIAQIFEDTGVEWKRSTIWKYNMENKVKSYTPDFYLPKYDLWIEVKGYWWGNDKEKMDIVCRTYPERKILIIQKDMYKRILQGEQPWNIE